MATETQDWRDRIEGVFGDEGIKTDITFKPDSSFYFNIIGVGLIILILFKFIDLLIFSKFN